MSGGVPKKHKTKSGRNQRRSHIHLRAIHTVPCPQCKTPVPQHTACPTCGTYRGRTVIDIAARDAKEAEKERARRRTAAEEGRA